MKLLFISDLHLPIGPVQPLRPELRSKLKFISPWGSKYLDRMDKRLRFEASQVQKKTLNWLDSHDYSFDTIINGGDNALPLNDHKYRMQATEQVWTEALDRYGESRFLALTGNHELGHGYAASLKSYPDLMNLRQYLFDRDINRYGYGWEKHNNCSILAIDSETIFLAQKYPQAPAINQDFRKMNIQITRALKADNPLLILTHNTHRTRKYLMQNGFKNDLLRNNREIVMVGGHFHIPRLSVKNGISEYWSGGASYPEPMAEWLENIPLSGVLPGGAGGIEINLNYNKVDAVHRSFSEFILPVSRKLRNAA